MKDASGERIAKAVQRILAGDSPLEQGLTMRLLQRLTGRDGTGTGGSESGPAVETSGRNNAEGG